MALRTLDSPGVEIHEIDKSQYSPSMTGTKCYVMGYADRGECYQPMQFTSKAAWQNYYGDPDNEAERYFYNACSEVLNQNGVLYSARLPYENRAKDKMVGYKFKVSTFASLNPTAGEYLQTYPVKAWTDHDSDFEQDALNYVFDNKCLREIDGNIENGLEHDTEVRTFYKVAIRKFNGTYDKMESFARYSIDYYETIVSSSQALSARFHTKAEAIDYLEGFRGVKRRGNYMYVVDEGDASALYNTPYHGEEIATGISTGSYCLKYDEGDWIAQPLYCKYNKEATILSVYPYNTTDINLVSDLVEATNKLSDEIGSDFITITNIEVMKKNLAKIYSKVGVSPETLRTCWDISVCLAQFQNQEGKKGDEIKRDGYLYYRMKDLLSCKVKINALNLMKPDVPLFFEVPQFHEIANWRDGANNEFLMSSTTSALYEDKYMNMSAEQDDDGHYISSLWNVELWHTYKTMCLSDIIRFNQDPDVSVNPKAWKNRIDSWDKMLSVYKDEGDIKFEKLILKNTDLCGATSGSTLDDSYGMWRDRIHDDVPYYRCADLDKNLHDYLTITQSMMPITCDLTDIAEYTSDEAKVAANTFWIFDKTNGALNRVPEDDRKGKKRECIGIFPVVTTVANALYAQSLISPNDDEIIDYETLSGLVTKSREVDATGADTAVLSDCNAIRTSDCSMKLSQCDRTEDDTAPIETVSREANGYFLPVQMNQKGDGIDLENAKKIGVVVYKAYLDASEGNKISFTPVESFCGSLDKDAKNPNTGVSTFLDKIINTQSEYIYFCSNCFVSTAAKKEYNDVVDFFICKAGTNGMLGWFSDETLETISMTTQWQSMDKCFQKVEDINERDIDIVCDAGLANIAQYMKSIYGGKDAHYYDLAVVDEGGNSLLKNWTCKSASDVNAWKTTMFKYDNFCKNVRKDCMFIADGPRPLVLAGEKKIIRSTKPSNTIDANILPYVKYCTGLNTNYGAGYLDWFQITDEFTGDEFWCPPSIKAMGVYINTDLNFNYWDAPAGLNRGVIQALDVAFSPTSKQSGPIYTKNWNYAINYPNDGIVLEGQKTFQVKPSALDRVNVRRLMLRLERQVGKVLRYVVYEGNTAYMRQRVIDLIDPYFLQAKVGGGVYDYKIVCDESNNTPNTIDNNELHIAIGIKPTKTIEFIIVNFVLLSTGASWDEMS